MMQEAFPHAGAGITGEILSLYNRAAESLNIGPEDLLLARDIAEMAARTEDFALHLLLLLMLDALNSGSLCLPLDPACLDRSMVSGAADMILAALEQDRWHKVVTRGPDPEFKPLILHGRRIYFHRYFEVEQSIRKSIDRLIERSWPVDTDAVATTLKHTLDAASRPLDPVQARAVAMALVQGFSIISGGPGTGKTTVASAIVQAVTRFNVLTGTDCGAIRLAAPTGRAAARLEASVRGTIQPDDESESVSKPVASTIHRLLGIGRGAYAWQRNRFRPLSASFILVDEASMVDAVIMARLLESIPERCRLVLMGDRNQLPSVEAGAVLSDLVPEKAGIPDADTLELLREVLPEDYHEGLEMPGQDGKWAMGRGIALPVTILEHSYRSSTEIAHAARAIRDARPGDTIRAFSCFRPLMPEEGDAGMLPGEGAWFVEPGRSSHAIINLLRAWFNDAFFKSAEPLGTSYTDILREFHPDAHQAGLPEVGKRLRELFAIMERTRVLCLTRSGGRGTRGVNAVASSMLKPVLSPVQYGHLFHGAQVMSVENDYARGIFNGDMGLVLAEHESGNLNAWFNMPDGTFRAFPVAVCRTLVPAFAITVHKSQGSEYDRVLLMLPEDEEHRLLSREILYTGVTRARDMVLVAGSKKAFSNAVSRHVERYSGLWEI